MDNLSLETKALIALQYVEDLSYKKKRILVDNVCKDDFVEFFQSAVQPQIEKILGEQYYATFRAALQNVEKIINELKSKDIHWVSYLDDDYPSKLLEIEDYPIVLFAKGNTNLLSERSIAVVGTRKPTRYGAKVTDSFVRQFANAKLVVTSGFARGIDSIAHKACVDMEAPTIAVFACGLDICYPSENKGLMEYILQNDGLLLTEYPLRSRPQQYHFPERNRIISGLSDGVFIAEATEKSGSLITARLAVEQGKDLFVVPGNIYSDESAGTNKLLREMPHSLVIEPDDVLRLMHIETSETQNEVIELSIVENVIVEALKQEDLHFEQLLELTSLSVTELNTMLLNLELYGIIQQLSGNFYSLC